MDEVLQHVLVLPDPVGFSSADEVIKKTRRARWRRPQVTAAALPTPATTVENDLALPDLLHKLVGHQLDHRAPGLNTRHYADRRIRPRDFTLTS